MLPPTAPGVMTQAASGNGYIGYFDGGAYGIPHSSKNNRLFVHNARLLVNRAQSPKLQYYYKLMVASYYTPCGQS